MLAFCVRHSFARQAKKKAFLDLAEVALKLGRRTYIFPCEKGFDYKYGKSVMQGDPLEKPSEKNGGGESLAHPDGLFKCY